MDEDKYWKARRLSFGGRDVEIQTLSRRVFQFSMRQRVLYNGVLDVASLRGLDRLWSDKGISSGGQARDSKCEKLKNTGSSLAETSPVLSRIDAALAVVLEQHGIGKLMLEGGIRNPPILHRLVEVKA